MGPSKFKARVPLLYVNLMGKIKKKFSFIMGAKNLKIALPPYLRAPYFRICRKKNPEKVTPSWRTDHLAMLKDSEVGTQV